MPHYADGTPVKIGDVVRGPREKNTTLVGVVHTVQPNSESCNMQVSNALLIVEDEGSRVVMPQPPANSFYATCKEFVKVAVWLLAITVPCLLSRVASAQYRTTYGRNYQPAYYQQQPQYQQPTVNRLDRKLDGSPTYNIGRSAEPPTAEAEKLFFTLVTSDAWQSDARERQIVSWLNNDPRLAKLRGGTRFNWYVASNPLYRDRLRYKLGEALPILAIQRPDGEVLLNVTALSMPRSSGELADLCDDAVNARYAAPAVPGHTSYQGQAVADCPNCDPAPPAPPHVDDTAVDPIPEVIPRKPDVTGAYAALAIFVGAGGVALLVVVCFGASRLLSTGGKIFP
jgi:hypothetical protein